MIQRALEILRGERRARVFLLAYAQSALGTGAAAVALMVVAYQRWHSPWAITIVLLGTFFPPGVLGPIFGAVVDRYSRRWCAIAADVLRAGAFTGIGLSHSIGVTLALAFVAGTGTALFSPAALAALPSLVERDRLPATTSLYGAINDLGRTVGPLLAAAAFPLISGSGIMLVNAATFAISALALSTLSFGAAATSASPETGSEFLREVGEGLRWTVRMPVVRVVVFASTAVFLFAGIFNVAELLFARSLGASSSTFALLVMVQGAGVVVGSLSGGRRGGMPEYRGRYLFGILASGAGFLALGATTILGPAFAGMLVIGLGNGIIVVHERLIFQELVPDVLMGRAFAVLEALGSWAFFTAYLLAGGLIAGIGVRTCLVIAGIGMLAVWATARIALSMRRGTVAAAAAAGGEADSHV